MDKYDIYFNYQKLYDFSIFIEIILIRKHLYKILYLLVNLF